MKRLLIFISLIVMAACSEQAKYEWEVIGRTQKAKFIYLAEEGFADSVFVSNLLGDLVVRGDYNQIYFFDNKLYTPKQMPMTDEQMLHFRAKYFINPSNGHEEFVFIEITDSKASPPDWKEVQSAIRPIY